MYLGANDQIRTSHGSELVSSARDTLQSVLFDGLSQRESTDAGLPDTVFLYTNVCAKSIGLWDWAAEQGVELVLRSGNGMGKEWVAANSYMFGCLIVDAEYLGDLEDTVDFCMSVRKAVPSLPILLVSTEVSDTDLSSERMMACDATVKWPASSQAITEGVRAASENHKRFLAARYGVLA